MIVLRVRWLSYVKFLTHLSDEKLHAWAGRRTVSCVQPSKHVTRSPERPNGRLLSTVESREMVWNSFSGDSRSNRNRELSLPALCDKVIYSAKSVFPSLPRNKFFCTEHFFFNIILCAVHALCD